MNEGIWPKHYRNMNGWTWPKYPWKWRKFLSALNSLGRRTWTVEYDRNNLVVLMIWFWFYWFGHIQPFMFVFVIHFWSSFIGGIFSVMHKFFGHIHSVMLIWSNDYSYSKLTSNEYSAKYLKHVLANNNSVLHNFFWPSFLLVFFQFVVIGTLQMDYRWGLFRRQGPTQIKLLQ